MLGKDECLRLENMRTIGYWSILSGVEVKEIINGYDDYVLCISNSFIGNHKYHKLRVCYTNSGRPYVRLNANRLYLDECIRN